MDKISKALGAAAGGGLATTGAIPFLPEGTPWWGYLLAYSIGIGLPMLATYVSPKNAA